MGHPVELTTPRGPISGWRADPPIPPRGAVIVVQEIFGVNHHMREQVDRLAGHGFIAVAPAFFDHIEPGIELGYDAEGVARGRELVEALGFEAVLRDLEAIAYQLDSEAPVGVVGFCWGGTVALLANTRLGLPAVDYYGARSMPFLHERLRAPMLFHFGEHDPLIPPEHVEAHRKAWPEATVHVYPAGHGFNCDQRSDYHAASARQAMDRTVRFLTRHLKS